LPAADCPFGTSNVAAFVRAIGQLGWVENRNVQVDIRWNASDPALAKIYAAQLIGLQPDAILCSSTMNLVNLRQGTNSIPIVFVQVSDPVAQGFVSNLTRPGGNITGFSAFDFSIGGKWVDLLKQIQPELAHVAVLFNPDNAPQTAYFLRAIQSAANALGVQLVAAPVHGLVEAESTIANLARQGNGGAIFPTGGLITAHLKAITELVSRHRVPAIAANFNFTRSGGLMSYGWEGETADHFRQAASYVDRILNGTKPGELPVQQATKYTLIINMKAAKALGITVPLALLGLADQVIE
jgi:putative ABC transport system substrate-binding protein